MIALSDAIFAEGKGVAVKDNKFIGPPMPKIARKIVEKNQLVRNYKFNNYE